MVFADKIGVDTTATPDKPKLTTRLLAPRLYVTTAEGVPVKINVEAEPEHMGELTDTVAERLEATTILVDNAELHPLAAI